MNTAIYSISGGLLIGLSAILAYTLFGKITGISGISFQAISKIKQFSITDKWPWVFLTGLVLGGFLTHQLLHIPTPELPSSPLWLVIISGSLVGIGSQIGSGCTSGHGICGIGRLSKRSITATLIFMLTGVIASETINFLGIL
jgi:hypothetical protein